MAAIAELAARPERGADATAPSRYRTVGLALAIVGLMGAAVSVIGNLVAGAGIDADNTYQQTLAWTFGLSIFSFGVVKIAIATILMGMMVMAAGIITNFVAAGAFNGTDPADLIDSAQFGALASGLRRLGVASHLTGIAFGLATIIEVLRFQATRIGEVAARHGHQH
jgi:hypothetical protein